MTDVAEATESVPTPKRPTKRDDVAEPLDLTAMIEAATKRVLAELATAPRAPLKNCGNCRHWTKLHAMTTHGQCMLSGKATVSPALTTDLARCSGWQDL